MAPVRKQRSMHVAGECEVRYIHSIAITHSITRHR